MTTQDSKPVQTPVTPDLKHRFDDYPQNNIINAVCQIDTILNFLYASLDTAQKLPPATHCTVERLISDKTHLINNVTNAIYIVDSLNSDVKAIAQAMD